MRDIDIILVLGLTGLLCAVAFLFYWFDYATAEEISVTGQKIDMYCKETYGIEYIARIDWFDSWSCKRRDFIEVDLEEIE